MNILKSNLNIIQGLVDNKLNEKGFNYSSSCDIDNKHFPSRYYDNYLLEEGEYDALIVTLGEGKGDNWWCVVYPPLCFVNKNCEQEQDIVYNSRLMEIIRSFLTRRGMYENKSVNKCVLFINFGFRFMWRGFC